MTDPVEKATVLLKEILENSNIDEGHGIEHALIVLSHTDKALEYIELEDKIKLAIRLASLLHDADDRKFFSKESRNAETIINEVTDDLETRNLVHKMINLVSCSKNGIGRPETESEWLYYPRWSDRLEALGKGGILRAYQYTCHKKRPLANKNTPKTNSNTLLYGMIATPRRFQRYLEVKESDTFIDHFYDKILHLIKGFQTTNPYYIEEVTKRHKIVEDFVLEYCSNQNVKELVNKYCFC